MADALSNFLYSMQGWEVFIFIFVVILFFVGAMVVTVIIMSKRRYPIKVTIFEDVDGSGRPVPSRKDKARRVKIGDGGEEVYYLKKHRVYRLGYGKNIGKNYLAYAIGSDGLWYNITFGSLDKKLMQIGVIPVEKDMRFANTALRKNIETRYNTQSFFQKWAVPITIGILIIAIIVAGVSNYLTNKKQLEIAFLLY